MYDMQEVGTYVAQTEYQSSLSALKFCSLLSLVAEREVAHHISVGSKGASNQLALINMPMPMVKPIR